MEQDLFMALVRWGCFRGSNPGCLCEGAALTVLPLCLLLPVPLPSLLLWLSCLMLFWDRNEFTSLGSDPVSSVPATYPRPHLPISRPGQISRVFCPLQGLWVNFMRSDMETDEAKERGKLLREKPEHLSAPWKVWCLVKPPSGWPEAVFSRLIKTIAATTEDHVRRNMSEL